jgi:hypothetical protein
MAQVVEHLLSIHKAPSSTSSIAKKKKPKMAINIRNYRTGGVAEVVEYLLCKHKALSSNSPPPKASFNRNYRLQS